MTQLAIWIERLPTGDLRRVEQLVRETEDEGFVADGEPYPVENGYEQEDAAKGICEDLTDLEPYFPNAKIVAAFFGD